MGALKGLLNSEKGIVALALIVASTVLVGLGKLTSDVWVYFNGGIYAAYVTGKTVQGNSATKAEAIKATAAAETAKAAAAVETARAAIAAAPVASASMKITVPVAEGA